MKILVLSFYYSPDLSAGSFRSAAIVKAIKAREPAAEISVVTSKPNRYHSFSADAPSREKTPEADITRIAIPSHKSGMIDQSVAYSMFVSGALSVVKGMQFDLVYATSSRLMTAVLGSWIARKNRCACYLDIRDIFVDTIKDIMPRQVAWLARALFSLLERWAVSGATKVNLVSGGFRPYFESRYPDRRFACFTNGIDDEFVCTEAEQTAEPKVNRPLVAIYAGNLGQGQGIHEILPRLAKRCEGRVRFKIFGDGGRKTQLLEALSKEGASNVEVCSPVSRDQLLKEYLSSDILFAHLGNFDAFHKVLPSKVFEMGALGKPIWAGFPGYAAEFVERELSNAAVFPPGDVDAALQALDSLVIQNQPRPAFIARYSRQAICREMAKDIVEARDGG